MISQSEAAPAALLEAMTAIADAAGRAILAVYATAFSVETKADDSPLTAADRAAHDVIDAGLKRLAPDVPVLSEESAPALHDYAARRDFRAHWLVDPLDGTREFVNRSDEFTVNIALVRDHCPVLGVVLAPALDLCYGGGVGVGPWRRRAGVRAPIAVRRPAGTPPVIAGSRSHRGSSLDDALGRIGAHELRPMGSALKFCLVADGSVDLYPRLGGTYEWDTAAGQAVVEAAGGLVTDLHGEPLRYNRHDSLLNPPFLALGDEARDWHRYF